MKSPDRSEAAAPHRQTYLTRKTKWGWGGYTGFIDIYPNAFFQQLAYPLFNIFLGMNPGLIGLMLGLRKFWDAFTDPLIGNWSDNTKSRWGRRRPFIFVGSLLMPATFLLIYFIPQELDETPMFYYLMATSLVFYLAYTVLAVPLGALGLELTPNPKERNGLFAARATIAPIGWLLTGWYFAISQAPIFTDMMQGVRVLAVVSAVVMAGMGLWLVANVRERPEIAVRASKQPKARILKGIAESFQIKPFRYLFLSQLVFAIGFSLVSAFSTMMLVFLVLGGDKAQGAVWQGITNTTTHVVSMIVALLVVPPIALRLGKRRTLIVGMGFDVVAAFLRFFCYLPGLPFLVIIPWFFTAISSAKTGVMTGSMMADICDYDELVNGQRREGLFSAVWGWLNKTAYSIGTMVSGFLLVAVGYDVDLGAEQGEQTFFLMRAVFAFVPGILGLLGFYFAYKYELTDERMEEVERQLIEKRKAQDSD